MSDPFQPAEQKNKRSLECLKLLRDTQYPFIVSTKNKLISEEPYLSLIKDCNCVVQFSAACSGYDRFEDGASSFMQRMEAAKILSKYVRVNIRIQPYIPKYFQQIMDSIDIMHDAVVHGVIVESMKYKKKANPNLIKVAGDFVYRSSLLMQHYAAIKEKCHKLGMKFYCGENRLRNMGDSLCCCGVDGMGWQVNTANLNHYLFDRENYVFRESMKAKGEAGMFKAIMQSVKGGLITNNSSYMEIMQSYESKAKSILTPFDLKK